MKKTFNIIILAILLMLFLLQTTGFNKQQQLYKSDDKLNQILYIVNEFEIQNLKGDITSFDIGWDLKASQSPLNITSKFIFRRIK